MLCKTEHLLLTTIGGEGIIEPDSFHNFISDEVDTIVSQSVDIYQNEALWKLQQKKGFNILSERFNKTVHVRRLLNKLENLITNKENYRLQNFTGSMLNFHTMQSTKYMSRWIEAKNK